MLPSIQPSISTLGVPIMVLMQPAPEPLGTWHEAYDASLILNRPNSTILITGSMPFVDFSLGPWATVNVRELERLSQFLHFEIDTTSWFFLFDTEDILPSFQIIIV